MLKNVEYFSLAVTCPAKTEIVEVKKMLKENAAVLVSDFGLVTDIITRYDLINLDTK